MPLGSFYPAKICGSPRVSTCEPLRMHWCSENRFSFQTPCSGEKGHRQLQSQNVQTAAAAVSAVLMQRFRYLGQNARFHRVRPATADQACLAAYANTACSTPAVHYHIQCSALTLHCLLLEDCDPEYSLSLSCCSSKAEFSFNASVTVSNAPVP